MLRSLIVLSFVLFPLTAFAVGITHTDSLAESDVAGGTLLAQAPMRPPFDTLPAHAHSVVFRDDIAALTLIDADSVRSDSTRPAVHRKLLPDNMSFMERGLWGENGFMRTIGIASPLTPDVRKHELDVRRTMLTMHQIGGFATLASMLATVYYGQKSLDNLRAGVRNDPYRDGHENFVAATIGLYTATGLLAILTPPPLIRRDEISTTTIHKTLAWIHAAGMILTPIIGQTIIEHGATGRTADLSRAHFHQVSAYITTAVFAASMITVTF
jgi:hypothetical protein